MAAKTFYVLGTAAVTPNFFGNLQDGGSAPTAANSTYGWAPAKTALTSPYYQARLGASSTQATASTTSTIDSKTIPTKGTGATNTTAGDSFVTPNRLTGTFAATAWTFNWNMRAGVAGCVGQIRMQVFASVNADGTSARKLTTSTLVGTAVTLSTSADTNSSISWSPGAITLANEYLFFQLEWQETTVGSSNTDTVLFRIGTSTIVTPNLTINLVLSFSSSETLAVSAVNPNFVTVADNFNRADGVLGSNWTEVPGATGLTISSNKIFGSAGAFQVSYWSANAFKNDQFSQITSGSSGQWIAPVVRQQAGVLSHYRAYCDSINANIYLVNNGSATLLNSASYTPAAGQLIRLEISGSTLTCKVNGVTIVTATDTTFSSGYAGVAVANGEVADNWSAGPIILPTIYSQLASLASSEVITLTKSVSYVRLLLLFNSLVHSLSSKSILKNITASIYSVLTIIKATSKLPIVISSPETLTTFRQKAYVKTISTILSHQAITNLWTANRSFIALSSQAQTITTSKIVSKLVSTFFNPQVITVVRSASKTLTATSSELITAIKQFVPGIQVYQRLVSLLSPQTVSESKARSVTITISGGPSSVLDNFNRANGSLGSNWIVSPYGISTPITISNNQVIGGSSNNWVPSYWSNSVNTFSNDQYSQATAVGSTSNNSYGVVVRHLTTGVSSFYAFLTAGFDVYLFRYDGGTPNLLNSVNRGVAITAGDLLRLEIVGNTLTAKVNGTTVLTATDSAYANGQPGIVPFSSNDIMDNWLGGPITGGGANTQVISLTKVYTAGVQVYQRIVSLLSPQTVTASKIASFFRTIVLSSPQVVSYSKQIGKNAITLLSPQTASITKTALRSRALALSSSQIISSYKQIGKLVLLFSFESLLASRSILKKISISSPQFFNYTSRKIVSASANFDGVSSVAFAGKEIASARVNADGLTDVAFAGTTVFIGTGIVSTTGQADGVATVSFAGREVASAKVNADGVSSVSFIGQETASARLNTDGVSTVNFNGHELASARVNADGVVDVNFVGSTSFQGIGTVSGATNADGISSVAFAGKEIASAVVNADGLANVSFIGHEIASARVNADGVAGAAFTGSLLLKALASFNGVSSVDFRGAYLQSGAVRADGIANVLFTGSLATIGYGRMDGQATVLFYGAEEFIFDPNILRAGYVSKIYDYMPITDWKAIADGVDRDIGITLNISRGGVLLSYTPSLYDDPNQFTQNVYLSGNIFTTTENKVIWIKPADPDYPISAKGEILYLSA